LEGPLLFRTGVVFLKLPVLKPNAVSIYLIANLS
jgi:hypothetical protein